jgi:hypothetical protein
VLLFLLLLLLLLLECPFLWEEELGFQEEWLQKEEEELRALEEEQE